MSKAIIATTTSTSMSVNAEMPEDMMLGRLAMQRANPCS